MADHRPARRVDHASSRTSSGSTSSGTPSSSTPTMTRVVPDPRMLIKGDAQPTALIQRVLDGPSGALAAGVRNPLAGAQLRSTVTVRSGSAVVDLTALPDDPAPVLSDICAQIVWTLTLLRIRTVEIRVDGEPVDIDGIPPEQDRRGLGPPSTRTPCRWTPSATTPSAGALHTSPSGPRAGPRRNGRLRALQRGVSAVPRTGELPSSWASTPTRQAPAATPARTTASSRRCSRPRRSRADRRRDPLGGVGRA